MQIQFLQNWSCKSEQSISSEYSTYLFREQSSTDICKHCKRKKVLVSFKILVSSHSGHGKYFGGHCKSESGKEPIKYIGAILVETVDYCSLGPKHLHNLLHDPLDLLLLQDPPSLLLLLKLRLPKDVDCKHKVGTVPCGRLSNSSWHFFRHSSDQR